MLQAIKIDGFKSFKKFDLELRSGLNVIAGPNGSGKTNIIRFFEFLSYLTSGTLVEAVSRSGGAGAIFRQALSGRISQSISFSLRGQGAFNDRYDRDEHKRFTYEYDAIIELSQENNVVFFSKQEIHMTAPRTDRARRAVKPKDAPRYDKSDDLHMIWKLDSDGKGTLDIPLVGGAFSRSPIFMTSDRQKRFVDEVKTEAKDDFKNVCFFAFFRYFFEPMQVITNDLLSGRSYNIDPNVVRRSEDIAGEPGIKPDGGGLAATLYAAKTSSQRQSVWMPRYFGFEPKRYDAKLLLNLISYSKLVNPDIRDVDVQSDPIENRLRIFLHISYDEGELRLPLSLVSDGTAKWLSLVAAVLTNTSIFAIEEPENFLHPFMQREIVNIVRDTCSKSGELTFAVITTHSETLINCVRPEELIIVSMKDGVTQAVRPSNVDQLRKEISATGFGLGFYYLAGAVE